MFDLDAYLNRIGLRRAGTTSLATLRDVMIRHTATIPFENLDIALGQPVQIDIGRIQDKLVGRGRGGYCFEQNTLLRAALDALGFETAMLMGRVVIGGNETDERPRTHVFVKVTLAGTDYIVDAGIGSLSPVWPVAIVPDVAQVTPLETFRILARPEYSVLQARVQDEWRPVYRYTAEPSSLIDHVVANWFTSTYPQGRFTNVVMVALAGPGWRKTVFNTSFSIRTADGAKVTSGLENPREVRKTLQAHFGLLISAGEAEQLFTVMGRCAETDNPAFRLDA